MLGDVLSRRRFVRRRFVTRRRFVMETFCYGDVLLGDVLSRRRFERRRFVCASYIQTDEPAQQGTAPQQLAACLDSIVTYNTLELSNISKPQKL